MDYLTWFEVCPIAIGQNKTVKIEWDSDKDDKENNQNNSKTCIIISTY